MSRFVKLNFDLWEYADDGDTLIKSVTFDGHGEWQNMQFYKQAPTERELRLLAQIGQALNDLAKLERQQTSRDIAAQIEGCNVEPR